MAGNSKNVENIYAPTAGQRAFLVSHAKQAEDDPALIHTQFDVLGPLTDSGLLRAWQQTVAAFEALRMSVITADSGEPYLVVRNTVNSPVDTIDLSELSDDAFDDWLDQFKREDRAKGLNLEQAPVMRLTRLIRSNDSSRMVWTCHHMLLDGWSASVVVNALIDNCNKRSAPSRTAYRDYRRWLDSVDQDSAERFWREHLAGMPAPTLLSQQQYGAPQAGMARTDTRLFLDRDQVERLQQFSQQAGVTPATVLTGAWGIFVAAQTNQAEPVLGLVSSGRTAPLTGIESIVGQLSTLIPVRIRRLENEPISEWLNHMHRRITQCRATDYVSFTDILAQAEPNCQRGLFDALLIIHLIPASIESSDLFSASNFRSDVVSAAPLTVSIIPNEHWQIQAQYAAGRFDGIEVDHWLKGFKRLCEAIIDHPDGISRPVNLLQTIWQSTNAGLEVGHRHGAGNREALLDAIQAPQSQTELTVLSIFERELGRYPLSVDANFFEHGGNSIGVLNIVNTIEREFNVRIPVSKFIDADSPRLLATLLEKGGIRDAPVPSLIQMRAGTSPTGIYCLHAGGGHALFYRDFANRVDPNWSVYALQPKGVDGKEEPLANIEDMAEHYIQEIIDAQPSGPYHLMCYCFGGGLILEMADRLQQRGLEVGHLIIAEAPSPIPKNHPMARAGWGPYLMYEYLVQRRYIYLWRTVKALSNRLGYRLKRRTQTELKTEPGHLTKVQLACEAAFKAYRAPTSKHRITLVLGDDSNIETSNKPYMRNWPSIARDQQTIRVTGDHQHLFEEPFVRETSDSISALLLTDSGNRKPIG